MSLQDPQFLYIAFILPGLFGLTLVGEGVVKLVQDRVSGWFNLVTGLIFLFVVVAAYVIMSGGLLV